MMSKSFKISAVAALLIAAAPASNWSLEKKSDPITDARKVTLTLKQRPNLLLLQCDSSDAQPFSITVGKEGAFLGGPPILRLTVVRFNEAQPIEQQWGYSSYFAVAQELQRETITSIGRSKVLVLRLQDRNRTPVDLVFNLTGAATQIAGFKKACASLGMSF